MLFADTVWFAGFCNTRLREEFVIGADRSSRASFEKRKRNQQCSLVEDEFKVENKPPTGDVRDAQTDEPQSGEIKRYQPPWAVFPAFRGTKAKVWVVVWLRGSSNMWSNSQGLVPRKGRHGGLRVNPGELLRKQQARKVFSLCKLSNPHQ